MADYAPRDLGPGSIGGNGFWMCKDINYPVSVMGQMLGNTGLVLERPLEEALTFNKKLPYILSQHALHFRHAEYRGWQFYYSAFWPIWTNCGSFGGSTLYGWANNAYAYMREQNQRHADKVLVNNVQGSFVSDAVRIPLGESGYFDTLPGLFVVEPVAGTIVSGSYCYVTIKPYANTRVWWSALVDARMHFDWELGFGTLNHPYLRDASRMVRVDLSPGNHNKHLIPGVDIQFNTPLTGDSCIISVGHEYMNASSESGDLGSITGWKDCYIPISSLGLQPYSSIYSDEYWITPDFWGGEKANSKWYIYNVTGSEQSGCKFIVRPFIRLDQGNALVPFDQWFMGFDAVCSLTPGDTPWTITFANYQAGSPATVTLVFSDSGTDTTIKEINQTTFVPTGVEHTDGAGLKCDGTTLYRWDALGIYFVLSASLSSSDFANVCIRKGNDVEKWLYTAIPGSETVSFLDPPYSKPIGTWNAFENTGDFLPGSWSIPESLWTGIIQSQGYDLPYDNADIDPNVQHWYNHYFSVATWRRFQAGLASYYSNMNEYAVMVVCDDPRYFHVVPHTWNYCPDKERARYSIIEGSHGANGSALSTIISEINERAVVNCSGRIHDKVGGLVVRANQLSKSVKDLLADAGITFG